MKTNIFNSAKKLLLAFVTLFFINDSCVFAQQPIGQGNQGLWQAGTSQNGNKAVVTKRDVGINTSTPSEQLEVVGNARITDTLKGGNRIKIGQNFC